jgi:hypothetical protein
MAELPPVIPVSTLIELLPKIFPNGTPHRTYVVREMSAKTLFVMFYVGAVEGSERYMRPDQVTKMTDAQANDIGDDAREQWSAKSVARGGMRDVRERWYATNTREPIRDETLRSGLVALGAVVERQGLPTTSDKPRYAVSRHFADLLVTLASQPMNTDEIVTKWQTTHLSATALSRIDLIRRGTVQSGSTERVKVTFPNGEVRLMRPGPSTVISKAVIEEFASRFLREAGIIFVSESGDKVIARDETIAKAIGLNLEYDRNLPDIVLADTSPASPKVVFVEVVATDGPINEQRKHALLKVASSAGYKTADVYFVSAFADRGAPSFKKCMSQIAWGTFAWFSSEPDKLLAFREGTTSELHSLLIQ